MIRLSDKWQKELMEKPETGMGFQIASVFLKDGRKFQKVLLVEDLITEVRGLKHIPFTEDQIDQITLTHDKWDFNAERKIKKI